jgi:3D (Asp-Asp-Asp) domain-containing protein
MTAYGLVTTMLVVSTAYSPGDPSQGTGWQTSTGRSAKLPGVAVDPRVIPYGSRVHVPGIGWLTADDCGGAIRGNRIDIRMQSKAKCLEWGRRTVSVTVRIYRPQPARGRRTLPEITNGIQEGRDVRDITIRPESNDCDGQATKTEPARVPDYGFSASFGGAVSHSNDARGCSLGVGCCSSRGAKQVAGRYSVARCDARPQQTAKVRPIIRAAAWTPTQEPDTGGRLYSALLGAVLGLCLGGAVILGIIVRLKV